jgi:ArsR family transcriptional regulator, arsenate/arsenite/antimonite-responsive transcriptional repressor
LLNRSDTPVSRAATRPVCENGRTHLFSTKVANRSKSAIGPRPGGRDNICQGKYMAGQLTQMESLFKALADSTRLRILGLLLTGEVCVCDIHESLKIPQPKASRHLAYLRRSGLVETRREGLWIHYRLGKLDDPVLAAMSDAVRHALTHVDSVHRDAERLRKRTGCCVPTPNDVVGVSCCTSQPAMVSPGR